MKNFFIVLSIETSVSVFGKCKHPLASHSHHSLSPKLQHEPFCVIETVFSTVPFVPEGSSPKRREHLGVRLAVEKISLYTDHSFTDPPIISIYPQTFPIPSRPCPSSSFSSSSSKLVGHCCWGCRRVVVFCWAQVREKLP
jgi:hypothetical protein